MAELLKVTGTANISSETQVIAYTHTGTPIEVYARLDVGTSANPAAGNGSYSIRVYIDNVRVLPHSDIIVPLGVTQFIACSRPVMLDAGDVISIKILGQTGDTAVGVTSSIRDATPARATEIYGEGPVMVDHNYGGTDNLAYLLDGAGIDNACIHCYLKADYDAGNLASGFIVARSTTVVGGRWAQAMMLDPENYTLVFFKQGITGPDTREITVV